MREIAMNKNSARETLREFLKNSDNAIVKDAILELHPELAESKDEKIRKKIIEHFKSKTKKTWCNIPVEDIISYLENQKELPFVKDVMLGYPAIYFYDGERMHFQGNPAMEEKQEEQKDLEKSKVPVEPADIYADEIVKWEDAHPDWDKDRMRATALHFFKLRQKWSEEDEKQLNWFYRLLDFIGEEFPLTWGQNHKGGKEWLKSFRPQPQR